MILPVLITTYAISMISNFLHVRDAAIERAVELVGDKGVVNLGAGCHRSGRAMEICQLPEVVANVDLVDGGVRAIVADLEKPLPFGYRQFDVAYASHVLEHLTRWEDALTDWCRVADHVVVVLPHPLSVSGYISPEHKQYFGWEDIAQIQERWPQVEVFI